MTSFACVMIFMIFSPASAPSRAISPTSTPPPPIN
jgi:hypothetical protein